MEKLNSYLGIARNDYLYVKNAMSQMQACKERKVPFYFRESLKTQ